jgi:hypothetical protein
MGKVTSSMTGVGPGRSLRRRPRFVRKEGAALDRTYGRPGPGGVVIFRCPERRPIFASAPSARARRSISSDCRGPVGPSTASVYRPPPGNWQSRLNTREYLLRGQCGRCGRSRPAIFWRTDDTEKAVPGPGLDLSRLLTSCYASGFRSSAGERSQSTSDEGKPGECAGEASSRARERCSRSRPERSRRRQGLIA